MADLARLALTPDEIERMVRDLAAILDYVELLGRLDLEGIEPTAHALPVRMQLREDEPRPSFDVALALANAPRHDGAAFVVPKVIEGEEG